VFTIYRDDATDPARLVCVVESTTLFYDARIVEDLHAMLREHGDWMPLGRADELRTPNRGTVEEWARAKSNPIGGWYGLKKGYRGRAAMYVPPLMEALGLAELEHNPRRNRMRAS